MSASAIRWIWTCRVGFEQDVLQELSEHTPRKTLVSLEPGLVASVSEKDFSHVAPIFARQAMRVFAELPAQRGASLELAVLKALRESMRDVDSALRWTLQIWVPDSDAGNRRSAVAETLFKSIVLRASAMDVRWADRRDEDAHATRGANGWLAQACLRSDGSVLVGGGMIADALSIHAGGRARMRVAAEAPSRAAMKLEEALDGLGVAPARGEVCADLGAAPGGWSYVVLARGARVIAIDPGAMAPELARHKQLEHVRGSAFDYAPDEPVDWLLCDMVWRPLEVAALLARWAKRGWARMLVANIKLAMKDKLGILARVRSTLEQGGWQGIRMRQLYHDRDEITITAHTLGDSSKK